MMTVAFYTGKERPFNRLISWWTKGDRSHVELVFSDGEWASADYRKSGVRFKRMPIKSEHWEYVRLDETLFDEQRAREIAERFAGKGYDWSGIMGFLFRPKGQNPNKMFCSEFVMAALGFSDPWRFSPNACYQVLKRLEPEEWTDSRG